MSKITSHFTSQLPSSSETNIGEPAKEANKQVKRVLEQEKEAGRKERKVYCSYTDADRAAV